MQPVSSLDALRSYEAAEARKMRGECSYCGHTWRPRNPSVALKRCPACQHRGRGQVRVVTFDDQPQTQEPDQAE